MILKVLYFASIRERLGVAEEEVEMAENSKCLDLIDHLGDRGEAWKDLLVDAGNVRMAINKEFADDGDALSDGDEVAIFPPVTGG